MSRAFPQLEMEPVYGFFQYLSGLIYEMFFRGEVAGLENIPPHGGFIIAVNHSSHLDPPIVGSRLSRQVVFFARKTLWKPGVAAWWLDKVGTIPVDRDGGSDVTAIKRVLQTLKQGKVLILFPEGTRSTDGRLQSPKPGIGLIACRTQATVVPARIFGSFEAFGKSGAIRLGSPISVVFGRPLPTADYDEPDAGKDRYQTASERIMAAIARIEPPAMSVV